MRPFAKAAFSWITLTLGVLLGFFILVRVGQVSMPIDRSSPDWLMRWFEFAGVLEDRHGLASSCRYRWPGTYADAIADLRTTRIAAWSCAAIAASRTTTLADASVGAIA